MTLKDSVVPAELAFGLNDLIYHTARPRLHVHPGGQAYGTAAGAGFNEDQQR